MTIWTDQNAPQPAKPYITIAMLPFVKIGHDYIGRPDGSGDNKITGNREFTLSMTHDGTTPYQALTAFENIRMALNKDSVLQTLRDGGIVFVDSFPIQNLNFLQDTEYQERRGMDLLFRIAQESTDEPGYIAIVKDMEATYEQNEQTVLSDTFTIDAT